MKIDELENTASKILTEKKTAGKLPASYQEDISMLDVKQHQTELAEKFHFYPIQEAKDLVNQLGTETFRSDPFSIVARKTYTLVSRMMKFLLRQPLAFQSWYNRSMIEETLKLYERIDRLEKEIAELKKKQNGK